MKRCLRHIVTLLPVSIFFIANGSVALGDDTWPAFTVDWSAPAAPSAADVSFLLQAPAGKDGFVRISDGHLVRPDGQRLRIWGLNVTGKAALPPVSSAPVIATRLAGLGINCIRFHFMDRIGALIAADGNDTRRLDPEALDRLDRFVAELKQRGIYSDLNLNVYRTYKPGDGVRECEALGIGKGATYFDERLIELQREYARQLLTHTNSYTRLAYRDEPAVAVVELVNENSLVESWINNHLVGSQTNRASGTWHDIPPSYASALTEKYNGWLAKRFSSEVLGQWRSKEGLAAGSPIPRLRKEQFAQADKERFQAEAAFYMGLERDYFTSMGKFLRDDLGVKVPVVGDSDHGHGASGYPLLSSMAQLDIIDGHIYWQHPHYLTDPKTGKRMGFEIGNSPMVDDPIHSGVVQLSRSAVAGKPYTVSEANHPFPSEYACEGVPTLAAYAALQDWDGIFWYTLAHDDVVTMTNSISGHFDFAKDPVKISQLAAGALMFVRGDIKPARQTISRSYSRDQVIESLRLPGKEMPYFTPGFPLALPLQHAVRISSFDGPPTGSFDPIGSTHIVSDTQELVWQAPAKKSGRVMVETARSQALIGHLTGQRFQTKNLSVEIQTAFCAVTLSALGEKPVADADRLLLTVTARVANSGMEWNEKRTTLEKWGGAPTRLEPVVGRVQLTGLVAARDLLAQPLDGAGQPLGQPVSLIRSEDGWTLELGKSVTPWFLITVKR